jgi:hypothetical protein
MKLLSSFGTSELHFHSQNNDVTNSGTYFVTAIFSKSYVFTDCLTQLLANVNISYWKFDPILLVGEALILGDSSVVSVHKNKF